MTPSERQPLLSPKATNVEQLPLSKTLLLIPSFSTLLLFFVINNNNVIPLQGVLAREFDAFDEVTWVRFTLFAFKLQRSHQIQFLAVMIIAYSASLPLMGRLSAIFTARKCCMTGATILSLGTLLSGLAPNLTVFLIGRAFTGVGSAACLVTSFILLIQVIPPQSRPFYIAILNSVYTLGFPLGGILGGLAVNHWRPSFYLQAPLIMLAGGIVYVETDPGKAVGYKPTFENEQSFWQKIKRVDFLGIMFLVSSLVLSLYAFKITPLPKTYIAASAVLHIIFWVVEATVAQEPLIPASMLLHPPVFFGCLAIMIAMTSWFCFSCMFFKSYPRRLLNDAMNSLRTRGGHFSVWFGTTGIWLGKQQCHFVRPELKLEVTALSSGYRLIRYRRHRHRLLCT